jgi:hypothetical protein
MMAEEVKEENERSKSELVTKRRPQTIAISNLNVPSS